MVYREISASRTLAVSSAVFLEVKMVYREISASRTLAGSSVVFLSSEVKMV